MPSPFPGMDPYLEISELWSEVHSRLIVAIADAIAPLIRPKYLVAIEKRVYLSEPDESVLVGIPDLAVSSKRAANSEFPSQIATLTAQPIQVEVPLPEEAREGYLEIRETGTGTVVTVLELLSPKNKRLGEGWQAYQRKRRYVLASPTHLIEIDLLRGGKLMPIIGGMPSTDYRILVSQGDRRPCSDLFPFTLRDPIPCFPIPLDPGDRAPILDLQSLLQGVYDRGGYDLRINYRQPPPPPAFLEEDVQWMQALSRQ